MQTFVPFADFVKSAACLDRQRLGKQRVETMQIAQILAGVPSSWKRHPVVDMWRAYPDYLYRYQQAVCHEWSSVRGYSDTCLQKTYELVMPLTVSDLSRDAPWWLGNEDFHLSHRANLRRKDPKFYEDFEDLDLPYLWPTAEPGVFK